MPKIPIDLSSAQLAERFMRSSITYGASRVGKSVFGGTFPRPVIFASAKEGGYVSIQTMDKALRYDPDVAPVIFAVSAINETVNHFKEVETMLKKGLVKTIVFELTFYMDEIVARAEAAEKDGANKYAKWKMLDKHIQWIDTVTKAFGVRVAYNALPAAPGDLEKKTPGGILLPGKSTAAKLPASTDLTGYMYTEDRAGKVDRMLSLVPYGAYPAGHRYGSRMPPVVRNPTYRKLEDLFLGRAFADTDGTVLYGEAADQARARAVEAAKAQQTAAAANGVDLPEIGEGLDLPTLDS